MSEPSAGVPTREVLRASGVYKSYRNGEQELTVLSGVDLAVGPRELVAIIGASGSGKSTLLNVLGLLDPPDRGELQFEGQDLLAKRDRQRAMHRRRDFGFIFQFYHLFRELTALENVELAGRMRIDGGAMPARARRERAEQLLDLVGLSGRRRHRPSQLSGGERQRVAIARAIFHRPRVLFCDEPTGNLDRGTGAKVWELIESLRHSGECAFLLVTHDESMAAAADRVLHLEDGKLGARREQ